MEMFQFTGLPRLFGITNASFCRHNWDCNYTFPIDLTPNGIPFGAKSIGKV